MNAPRESGVIKPKLSIVVATWNRAQQVREALPWYSGLQTSEPWELILVDNGSSDSTPQMLQDFANQSNGNVRVVTERRIGTCIARNSGWRAAHADIIAFIDDDCYPAPDFVDTVLAEFHESRVDYIGGRVLLYDPTDAPMTLQERETYMELPAHTFFWANGDVLGCNLAARRSLLETLEGFDECLGPGTWTPSGEDVDFISRASAVGATGLYSPKPVVYHHHRRKPGQDIDRLERNYGLGRGAYFLKCCLDPARRYGLKAWYWSICADIKRSFSERRLRRSIVHEFHGAFLYASFRMMRKLRGPKTR
jgi:glycosyltransferase involved in cell wall biosynthesis